MANPNKRKGDAGERAVRDFLRSHGFPGTERTRAGYARDHGDLHLAPGLICQVKDTQVLRWSWWLPELSEQIEDSGADVGFLAVKRPQFGAAKAGQWLAVMTVEQMSELLRAAGYGTPLSEEESRSVASSGQEVR